MRAFRTRTNPNRNPGLTSRSRGDLKRVEGGRVNFSVIYQQRLIRTAIRSSERIVYSAKNHEWLWMIDCGQGFTSSEIQMCFALANFFSPSTRIRDPYCTKSGTMKLHENYQKRIRAFGTFTESIFSRTTIYLSQYIPDKHPPLKRIQ